MDAVVNLAEAARQVPFKGAIRDLFVLEALEFFDEEEFELGGYPRGKFEGDIFVRKSAAIATGRTFNTDGASGFNPLVGRKREAVRACCIL